MMGDDVLLRRSGWLVNLLNSYAAASLLVPVKDVSSVDLPTDGKPTSPTRVSPDLVTFQKKDDDTSYKG
jgi:hypothetical protein